MASSPRSAASIAPIYLSIITPERMAARGIYLVHAGVFGSTAMYRLKNRIILPPILAPGATPRPFTHQALHRYLKGCHRRDWASLKTSKPSRAFLHKLHRAGINNPVIKFYINVLAATCLATSRNKPSVHFIMFALMYSGNLFTTFPAGKFKGMAHNAL